MIRIRFQDDVSKRRALAQLAGRFPFTSWATGEMLVPEAALGYLAVEGICFLVEGPATYAQYAPALRGPTPRFGSMTDYVYRTSSSSRP
jgi:hypothetical protein